VDPDIKSPPVVPRKFSPFLLLGILIFIIFIGYFIFAKRNQNPGFISGLVDSPQDILSNTNGRTNIAFLGTRGEGQEGGDLTDSMMLISLNHSTHKVSLLTIPRDIWVDTMVAKVNTAYHYGQERREGGGLDLAMSAIGEITGQPVHYAIALDFAGFTRAIDAVGGIDVEVIKEFDDYLYPIPGKEAVIPESDRYEHLHFDSGFTHMNGDLALKFARSRHAEGEEGTDFARSARQRQIILAFQKKILSSETLLNLDTLKNIFSSFQSSIDTNIQDNEFGGFFRFFLEHSRSDQSISSFTFDELFFTPKNKSPYQGQWILIPIDNWTEIHNYVEQNL